jgi:hypothetical protein
VTLPAWFFPVLSICLNIGSAVVYACKCDWNRTIYWLAAAVLTTTVTLRSH